MKYSRRSLFHRYHFCETIRNTSNRVFELLTENGQLNTREVMDQTGVGALEDDADEASDGDDNSSTAVRYRYKRDYTDPHKMNFPGPSGTLLERMSIPMWLEEGVNPTVLLALLPILEELADSDPSLGLAITGVRSLVFACVLKFDGTPLAGGASVIGAGQDKRLVGPAEKVDVPTVRRWLDEAGGDKAKLVEKIKLLSQSLHRGVDAYHVECLALPICFHVGDYYHTSASYSPPATIGAQIQAQRGGEGRRYKDCTVLAVHDDGTLDVRYSDGHIERRTDRTRDPSAQSWRVVLRHVQSALRDVQKCFRCLREGCECVVECPECTARGSLCDSCAELQFDSIVPELRACFGCQRAGCRCKRITIYIVESDKEAANKKALMHLLTLIRCNESHCQIQVVFGIEHMMKGSRASLINHFLVVDGEFINILDLIHLWYADHNNLQDELTKEALLYKDRHNTDHIYRIYCRSVRSKIKGARVKVRHRPTDRRRDAATAV